MKKKELSLAEMQQLYEQEQARNAALEKENALLSKENQALEQHIAISHDAEHAVLPEEQIAGFSESFFQRIYIDFAVLQSINGTLTNLVNSINHSTMPGNSLTDAERRRMNSIGMRRYGFTDTIYDMSENSNNLDFYPSHANIHVMRRLMDQLESLRNFEDKLTQMRRVVRDNFLVTSNAAYQIALAYYNNVRVAARSGMPGADALFNELRRFFRSNGQRQSSAEPTKAQLKRDALGLIDGTKTGKVLLENRPDTIVHGEHKFIDRTQKNYLRVDDDHNPDA